MSDSRDAVPTDIPPRLFVKLLGPTDNTLVSVAEGSDFADLQRTAALALGLNPDGFAQTWQLAWEDGEGDRLRLKDQADWRQAVEYQQQQMNRSPIRVVLASVDGTISHPSTESQGPSTSPPTSSGQRRRKAEMTFTVITTTTTTTTSDDNQQCDSMDSYDDEPDLAAPPLDIARTQSTEVFMGSEKVVYSRARMLGSGSFGTVYLGLNQRTGQMLALKEVALPVAGSAVAASRMRALSHEIHVLERLSHPNIVRYFGMQRLPQGFVIFMEYIPGGSIASLLRQFGPFSEELVCTYMRQTLQGLTYLHGEGILHRDIKGGNILVSDKGEVRLADFGSSKAVQDVLIGATAKHSIVGTVEWMAPEMIRGGPVTPASDVWSLGCVMLEMVYAGSPWSRSDFNFSGLSAMYHIGSSDRAVPHIPSDLLSPEACDLLQQCLQREAGARLTTATLLLHPWITGQGAPAENWDNRQADAIMRYIQESVRSHNLSTSEFSGSRGLPGSSARIQSSSPDLLPQPPALIPPPPPPLPPDSSPQLLVFHDGQTAAEALRHNMLDLAKEGRECLDDLRSSSTCELGLGPVLQRGALAHTPVPLHHLDRHLEALLREVPDPTHRELGLFRVLTARMERTEERLRQRLDMLEQLAATFLHGEANMAPRPKSGLTNDVRAPLLESPTKIVEEEERIAGASATLTRPLFEEAATLTPCSTDTLDIPHPCHPTLPLDRWREERRRLWEVLLCGQQAAVVVIDLLWCGVAWLLWAHLSPCWPRLTPH
eukprot:GGOE01044814.1.p1 GENE.GGOE01044814.1~~GGOE01044814.1.p1  ORF type:complete len:785 (-),score=242.90 GGOE01044814.1:170-2479(-)